MADRETVIVENDSSRTGIIAGIVIVALLILGFFIFFNGRDGGSGTVDVDVPAVSVDVKPDGQ
jgi:hypothetical protein